MEFRSPKSIPKPLAPINDQNLKKGRPVFLFKLVFEIRFSDALLATEVFFILPGVVWKLNLEHSIKLHETWHGCTLNQSSGWKFGYSSK